ncbi:CDP-alcohol phosphatidyltransferase family protein [Methylomonas koyamae]|uniref:CDP-alcohol phosphatidyltransferase family protein n=1 Tax=Methylomonas koyamae TaxID=702114 RepID=UPI0028732119|nr:CDP-alcohol phosphatidyltransferase family protein [Methylomonas koyamae]WNB74418.1 CDP-alcohol phosphatidyltransferase family protein [Methylomonas koyamae]
MSDVFAALPTQDLLRRELKVISMIGVVALLSVAVWLGVAERWYMAVFWLLPASAIWCWIGWRAWSLLDLNRAALQAPLYPALGWGNRVTLLRGWLIALAGGCLSIDLSAVPISWLPAVAYSLAALLDRCDGFLARRSRQVSLLGGELDVQLDALGLVAAPLLAIAQGRLHLSYLLLSAAFYLYRWAMQRRQVLGLPIYLLPDNPLRRALAGFQMGLVAVALWPWLDAKLTRAAGVAFMLPVLFGFIADWAVVCGHLSAANYQRLAICSQRLFQPGLRLLTAIVVGLVLPGLAAADISTLSLGVAVVMLAVGFAGRLAALALLLWLGGPGVAVLQPLAQLTLVFAGSWLLMLGSGRVSLWGWGDAWVARYDGA